MLRRPQQWHLDRWKDSISGHPAFIVGNGPSLCEHDLNLLDGCFSIGINRAYRIFSPIILLWQDRTFYSDGLANIERCPSIKVCRDKCNIESKFTTFSLSSAAFAWADRPSALYGYGCSGALGAELAVAMGASSLVLLGMDCEYDKSGDTDFYGKNPNHTPGTLRGFQSAMKWISETCPVPVYNCGRAAYWPQRTLRDVLDLLNPAKCSRLHWYTRLRLESEESGAYRVQQ